MAQSSIMLPVFDQYSSNDNQEFLLVLFTDFFSNLKVHQSIDLTVYTMTIRSLRWHNYSK
jgi:hypothetical protein